LIPAIDRPFSTQTWTDWSGATRQEIFYSVLRETPQTLNLYSIVTATVTECQKWNDIKVAEVSSGIDGWLYRGDKDRARYDVGDTVLCRVKKIDYSKFLLDYTTAELTDKEIADLVKPQRCLLVKETDFVQYSKLGKIEIVPETSRVSNPKTRRIIKHENYAEISHAMAVARLAHAHVGELIIRPSTSHSGMYLGMIKCKPLSESKDPSREDWIKIFRFTEGPSAKTTTAGGRGKLVFRIADSIDEFEEFDQMKALYVERYMRFLQELRSHARFRPESVEQVRNLAQAKIMANRAIDGSSGGSVVYFIAIDDRTRESAGNAVLIWGSSDKVHEDTIEINNKGFKYWTKGPYPSITSLVNWWKQGGYRERQNLIEEWKTAHSGKPLN
jgi:hypothetical protein